MQFIPVRTRLLQAPKDNLFSVFDDYFPQLEDGDMLFISSKILAIHQ